MKKAEKFYIEQHAGKKTPEELAKELGLSVRQVKYVLKNMKVKVELPSEPPAPVKPKDNFDRYKGSIIMTESQSFIDDEKKYESGDPANDPRRKGTIHKIRPEEPSY